MSNVIEIVLFILTVVAVIILYRKSEEVEPYLLLNFRLHVSRSLYDKFERFQATTGICGFSYVFSKHSCQRYG